MSNQTSNKPINPITHARNEVAKRMAWMAKTLKELYSKEKEQPHDPDKMSMKEFAELNKDHPVTGGFSYGEKIIYEIAGDYKFEFTRAEGNRAKLKVWFWYLPKGSYSDFNDAVSGD